MKGSSPRREEVLICDPNPNRKRRRKPLLQLKPELLYFNLNLNRKELIILGLIKVDSSPNWSSTSDMTKTIITSSPLRWGQETTSSHKLISSRASWLNSPTVARRSPHSHSSADCRSLTPCTSTLEAHRQDEKSPYPSSTLYPARRGDEGFLWSLHETKRLWREVEVHSRISRPHSRPAPGASSLQEAGAPYPPTKSALKLQIDGMLHSIEALDQRSFNTFKDQSWVRHDPAQSLTFQVEGILLLPRM